MSTSTVKAVFGPPDRQIIFRKRQVSSNRLRQFFGKATRVFSMHTNPFAVCALLSFASFTTLDAQTLNARITVVSSAPARIKIDARLPGGSTVLSFRNTYAGVLGLGERIETVEGIRDNGERVPLQKLTPGEFQSVQRLSRIAYEVNLAGPRRPADLSHVSSLNSDYGVLMMADLLPQSTSDSTTFASALIDVDVPNGWTVSSNIKKDGSQFSTDDPETAVFLVGPSLHEKKQRLATTDLSIITPAKWPFSDDDAMKISGEILGEYSRLTRFDLKRNVVLMLAPYPGEAGPQSWSAETRGNVVVLLLGRNARRKSVLSRLGIVLSHELFHLWVPNSLKLEGDYDWFFEGFTLYQALRMDLRLGLISFGDYLETIAGVYDSYRSAADGDRLSLIEASQRRWTTSASLVYEKGMLVAFIYDLILRKLTDCRASLDDVYAELFRLAATGQRSANETIIGLLGEREGLTTFARNYVESAVKIDLEAILPAYGFQVGSSGSGATELIPGHDLTKTQRKLLGCIGYRK
jgi:M61 glycyl aminopeptidase